MIADLSIYLKLLSIPLNYPFSKADGYPLSQQAFIHTVPAREHPTVKSCIYRQTSYFPYMRIFYVQAGFP